MIRSPIKVLYLGPVDQHEFVRARLGSAYDLVATNEAAKVQSEIADAAFVLDAYMRVRFDAATIGRALKLEAFIAATTGTDHVDAAALKARGIPLLSLRGQTELLRGLTPAAELSWFLLMACARGARGAIDEVLKGTWDRNNHPGVMLKGRRLGLVGCGRIGQWMSRYAAAFGMHCVGYDPFLAAWPDSIAQVAMNELLSTSDFVSIHVPLSGETEGLIGENEIAQMKRGVILVNTSRGEIIDELALLRALSHGRVAAAGLDVLTGEPEVADHPLVKYAQSHANLIITPHIGGFSPDALREVLAFCCKRIAELHTA